VSELYGSLRIKREFEEGCKGQSASWPSLVRDAQLTRHCMTKVERTAGGIREQGNTYRNTGYSEGFTRRTWEGYFTRIMKSVFR
jgi:hypothetical protein